MLPWSRKEAYHPQGWRARWLAQGHHRLSSTPVPLQARQQRVGLGNQGDLLQVLHHLLSNTWLILTICAAISPTLKMLCLCTSLQGQELNEVMCVDSPPPPCLCLQFWSLTPSLFFFLHWVLGETEITFSFWNENPKHQSPVDCSWLCSGTPT